MPPRHDALTGLANRAALLERMNEALARMQQQRGTLTLHILDLDGFKQVNDTLGHAAGDHLLKELASRLQSSLARDRHAWRGSAAMNLRSSRPTSPTRGRPRSSWRVEDAGTGGEAAFSSMGRR